MTFKQFSHWCNKRASDGLWGMLEALVCKEKYINFMRKLQLTV